MSHTFFITTAYGATALVFAGLVVWLVLDGRARKRELAALEKAGARRRSAGKAP
nr:heme exporter protein CcmD [Marinicella sp. W31]MDC2879088.1 heme exporter protein CcmD [Marinicella sp. W31]